MGPELSDVLRWDDSLIWDDLDPGWWDSVSGSRKRDDDLDVSGSFGRSCVTFEASVVYSSCYGCKEQITPIFWSLFPCILSFSL